MKKYIPSQIEPKWQKKWREGSLYLTDLSKARNKYYVLVELPYTSGDLHMGHWFTFTMGDILARFKARQGFNVLFPNGFDAFGLPAENAAIKQGIHPRDWTYQNMERMRAQFETLGTSIDWTKTMVACDPKYYKWNQWIFLKMLEKGLAYKGKLLSNWCPTDQTVLANENVEDGKCWRCGAEVVQKEVDQWLFRITAYAERLQWSDPPQADWPKSLREGQNDWIGKSEGINITYKVEGTDKEVVCFTTRSDTNFGATFIVLAPEHLLTLVLADREHKDQVQEYINKAGKKSELERKENKEKTGVFTGRVAINQLNGEKMPIWIADYVLMGYGTGAVVGVPGHDIRDFEFARKFGLPIKRVIIGRDGDISAITRVEQVQEDEGKMINSGFLDGLDIHEAASRIMDYLEEKGWGKRQTEYHLHDWSISRQRYWGTPIPVIHCDKCGTVPVPEKDLPVELPYKVDYAPKGKPPLATAEDWVNTECPRCGGAGKREVETMDTFVDSAWYFFRYLSSENDREIFDKDLAARWMPLEIYIGGPEHTLGHALYSRFFTMIFKDLGLINFDEYAKKRIHHGIILGPDGYRMSKSRGNVVNPDTEVKSYGADAVRLYLMFLGPFDIVTSWNPDRVNGAYHFLQRVWGLQEKVIGNSSSLRGRLGDRGNLDFNKHSSSANKDSHVVSLLGMTKKDIRMMHKTIKKVTEDMEQLKFNTAIAFLMEWLNHLSRKDQVWTEEYKTFLLLLAPFAPHITEELWQIMNQKDSEGLREPDESEDQMTGRSDNSDYLRSSGISGIPSYSESFRASRSEFSDNWSIHQQSWPKSDNKYLEEEEVSLVVQINGKVRDVLLIQKDIIGDREAVEKIAYESEKIQKFLAGKSVEKVVYIPWKIINFVAG